MKKFDLLINIARPNDIINNSFIIERFEIIGNKYHEG
jgi:hypothetical protein